MAAVSEKAPCRKREPAQMLPAVLPRAEKHDLRRRNKLPCQPIEYALHPAPLVPHAPKPLTGQR